MFRNQTRLRDDIVFMDTADRGHTTMDAQRYQRAARTARDIVERELGSVKMSRFVFPDVPALQTMAENIYFESYGCFADLDGSGDAARAQALAAQALQRARAAA